MKIFKRIITVVFSLTIIASVAFGCISTEQVKEKAYSDVLEELKANGNPTGMFGVTWYTTQQDVNEIFDDCYQVSNDILMHERIYYPSWFGFIISSPGGGVAFSPKARCPTSIEAQHYDRPVQVSYHFSDDRLMLIIVTFKDEFSSLEEFSEAFYKVQDYLSREHKAKLSAELFYGLANRSVILSSHMLTPFLMKFKYFLSHYSTL